MVPYEIAGGMPCKGVVVCVSRFSHALAGRATQFELVSPRYPWNTTAGSTTNTRCMLSRLEKILIAPTAKPVPINTSGGI
jgi:hypothetical protein